MADPAVIGIVITGKETFSGGADIKSFEKLQQRVPFVWDIQLTGAN